MAKTKYTVASDEGAAHHGVEVGEQVSLDLSESDERAQICAGWLIPTKKKEEK